MEFRQEEGASWPGRIARFRQLTCFVVCLILIAGCSEDRSGPPGEGGTAAAWRDVPWSIAHESADRRVVNVAVDVWQAPCRARAEETELQVRIGVRCRSIEPQEACVPGREIACPSGVNLKVKLRNPVGQRTLIDTRGDEVRRICRYPQVSKDLGESEVGCVAPPE